MVTEGYKNSKQWESKPLTLSLQREAEAVPTLQLMGKAPTERNAETN